jgi:hypothetical protein
MLAAKLEQNLRLAHAGGRVQQQAWHPISLGIMQQFVQPVQDELRARVANPAFRLNAAYALEGWQIRFFSTFRRKMVVLCTHSHTSTL